METESDPVASRARGREEGRKGVTASWARVSFWSEENVLELNGGDAGTTV